MRPPAIRRARMRYLTNLTHHFGLKPWDITRLRLWEFWTYVQGCDQLNSSADTTSGDDLDDGRGRRV